MRMLPTDVTKLCQEGRLQEALQIVDCMVNAGIKASIKTYACLLQGCAKMKALAEGKEVHARIVKRGLEWNLFLANNLIHMYAKCGSVLDARQIFDIMPQRDVFSWTAIISVHAKFGQGEEALNLFGQMQRSGVAPDRFVFVAVLTACVRLSSVDFGKRIHAHIIKSGCESYVFVGNALIDMYAKCGNIEDARMVFNRMCERDVVSWNALIAGCVQQGLDEEALGLYDKMQFEGVQPNKVTFVSILKACANLATLERGRQIHSQVAKHGCELDLFVGSTLVSMYAKCGSVKDAHTVFNKMRERNVVSWNALIAGYSQQGHNQEALSLFDQMIQAGVKPDNATFVSILKACASLTALERGKEVHAHIILNGFESDVFVGSTLVDMYVKCGELEDAERVFSKMRERNVVSWTAMIAGYARLGYFHEALTLFEQMQQRGVKPNNVTFVSVLKACASLAAVEQGKQIHAYIVKSGFESDLFVGSTLVLMYAKCGRINEACHVFSKMPERDVVAWTAMIAGYAQQGYGEKAFTLFEEMLREGVKPNNVTFLCTLKACATMAALEQGKWVHTLALESGFESDVTVGNTLIDMYAKCGSVEDAYQVFSRMHGRNVVSWNTMIAGCAQQGHGKKVISLFEQMQREGVKPNNVTFISLLAACSHAGLVDEGHHYFKTMSQHYSITPTMQHYACMVDLLGRAGHLDEAEDFINKMPVPPDDGIWMALLGACRRYANLGLGRHAFDCALKLEPNCYVAYVLLSNVYSVAGRWDEAAKIRKEMEDAGLIKDPACSWIEVEQRGSCILLADET